MPEKEILVVLDNENGTVTIVYTDGTTERMKKGSELDEVVVVGKRPQKEEQPKCWQQYDSEKSEQARLSWNQWIPQGFTDYSNPKLFNKVDNTSTNSNTPKALQTPVLGGNESWQEQVFNPLPIQAYDRPVNYRNRSINELLYKDVILDPSQIPSLSNYQGRATERHIQIYMSVIEESAKRMEELEKPIQYAQQGIEWLSKLLAAGIIVDLGMFWNYFYWIPKLGSDIVEGSEQEWMAEQIGLRAAELEEMIVKYNDEYQKYEQAIQALNLAFQSETITLDDGTTLKRTEDDDSTLIQMGAMGVAGLSIHKNKNNAKGTYVLYRIVVDGKVYKYGVADALNKRVSNGLPVRLAQQISKLEKILTPHNIKVEYQILKTMTTTKGAIKLIETRYVLKNILSKGIPIGNISHIRASIGAKIGYLSPKAMNLIIKYNKSILKYIK